MQKNDTNPRIRGIYLLPNLFTISALFAGFYAIVMAMNQKFVPAVIAIFIAMILDSLDGRVARMTNTQTDFGAQLDSLSDMVSFGVAPALIVYTWSLHVLGKPGWLAAFVYAVCNALRLARFNTQLGQADKRYFQGLAVPAAAALLMSIIWVCQYHHISGRAIAIVMFGVAIILGILMVSNIRYYSFKEFDMRGKVPFIAVLAVVLVFVLVAFDARDILLLMSFLYVVSGVVGSLYHRLRRSRIRQKVLEKRSKRHAQDDHDS